MATTATTAAGGTAKPPPPPPPPAATKTATADSGADGAKLDPDCDPSPKPPPRKRRKQRRAYPVSPPAAASTDTAHPAAAAAAAAADEGGGKGGGAPSDASSKPKSAGPRGGNFRGGQAAWNAMLFRLLVYKSRHGHTNVRHNDADNRQLYAWVQSQRRHYKMYRDARRRGSSRLTPDRVAALEGANFDWKVKWDAFWGRHFAALEDYKAIHGHCMVPKMWEENPKLGQWVSVQRREYRYRLEGKPSFLTDDRKEKLESVGFTWRVRDKVDQVDWMDRYDELLKFRAEHGHTVVPQQYAPNRSLGKWVSKQREQYRFRAEGKHSLLTEERMALLDEVGFVWIAKGRSSRVRQALEGRGGDSAGGGGDDGMGEGYGGGGGDLR